MEVASRLHFRKLFLFLVETTLILAAIWLSLAIKYGLENKEFPAPDFLVPRVVLIAVCFVAALYYNNLYDFKIIKDARELTRRLFQSIFLSLFLMGLLYTLFPTLIVSTGAFVLSCIILVPFVITWRFLYGRMLRQQRFSENLILVGGGELARAICEELKANPLSGFQVVAVAVGEEDDSPQGCEVEKIKVGDLEREVRRRQVTRVIVAEERWPRRPEVAEVFERLEREGVEIQEGGDFYEKIAGKVFLRALTTKDVMAIRKRARSPLHRQAKRLVDVVISLVGLVLSAPISLLAAVAVKLDSPGPVLFSQERVGEGGRVFRLYKFRSMRRDAEAKTGPVWATAGDARVTRVGRIIRKTRIDEIPQMWNILRGDMSFIGPRPERPYFVEQLKEVVPYYAERSLVKPGLTGYAQTRYRYGASVEDAFEKLQYDLYYIKNMSLMLDLQILVDTVKVVVLGQGAR